MHILKCSNCTTRIYFTKMSKQLEITYRGTSQLLDVKDILYIKSDNVYVEIFTTEKRHIQRKFLGEVAKELPSNFVRVHRSYLVNMDFVSEVKRSYIRVGDHKIPVSRKFKLEEA